jgi:hypothetical protein
MCCYPVQNSAHILVDAATTANKHAVLKGKVCTLARLTVGLSHVGNDSSTTAAAAAAALQQQRIQTTTDNRPQTIEL